MHSLPAPFLSVKDNFCYGLLSYLLYVYDKNHIPRSATTNQEATQIYINYICMAQ